MVQFIFILTILEKKLLQAQIFHQIWSIWTYTMDHGCCPQGAEYVSISP